MSNILPLRLNVSPHPDFRLESYRFDLPEDRIAQAPSLKRDASRLLVLNRKEQTTTSVTFADILRYLPENCLLIANNSKVIPARITGTKPSGGKVEFLLLTPPPLLSPTQTVLPPDIVARFASVDAAPTTLWQQAEAEGLLRSSKKMRSGDTIALAPDLLVEVRERGDFGRCRVHLFWQGDIQAVLFRYGALPLPPYIKRQVTKHGGQENASGQWGDDSTRYQTTYARADKAGSVAAPTAGLHFTPEIRQALQDSGREWGEVTLYVGYGTFSPVRCEDIREHPMHAEYVELPEKTARAIAKAKAEGRPVIAVGTTSARVLEGIFAAQHATDAPVTSAVGGTLVPFAGWINIFLYPGKKFHVLDGLLTNFHLPESSLLMLVSALAGREVILQAYAQASEEGFRFFSYGDAMLIV